MCSISVKVTHFVCSDEDHTEDRALMFEQALVLKMRMQIERKGREERRICREVSIVKTLAHKRLERLSQRSVK